jgi:cell division septation protein DedD
LQRPDSHKDELEFNDGMGDMLREKETLRFSWTKTVAVAAGIVAIVIIVFSLGFQLAKRQFLSRSKDLLKPVAIINQSAGISTASVQHSITTTVTTNMGVPTAAVSAEPAAAPVTVAKQTVYPYRIIAGSFKSTTRANACIRDLKAIGVDAFASRVDMGSRGIFFRVQAGAYQTAAEAQRAVAFLTRHGYAPFILD